MPAQPIYRKGFFQMKITATLLLLLVLLLPNTYPQESTRWGLPEGAAVRLGKGSINAVQYSPDGTRIAVAGSAAIWLYDAATYQEVAVLAGHTAIIYSVAFSPDGTALASASRDNMVILWGHRDG